MNRRNFVEMAIIGAATLAMCPERLLSAPPETIFRSVELWNGTSWLPVEFWDLKIGQWFRFTDMPDMKMHVMMDPVPVEPEGNFVIGVDMKSGIHSHLCPLCNIEFECPAVTHCSLEENKQVSIACPNCTEEGDE